MCSVSFQEARSDRRSGCRRLTGKGRNLDQAEGEVGFQCWSGGGLSYPTVSSGAGGPFRVSCIETRAEPWYPLHSQAGPSGENQVVFCCRVESAVSCRQWVLGAEEESGWPTLASSTKTYLYLLFPAFIKYLTEGSSHYQDNNLMQH